MGLDEEEEEVKENVWTYDAEEEDKYDKPSFLRRLRDRKKKSDDENESEDKKED